MVAGELLNLLSLLVYNISSMADVVVDDLQAAAAWIEAQTSMERR